MYLLSNLELIVALVNLMAAFFHVRIFDYLILIALLHAICYVMILRKLYAKAWRMQNQDLVDILEEG
jgi:hypothetical protein